MALQLSDTSVEKAGLLQVCESNLFGDSGYGQITGNPSRLAILTNFINEAYSRYFDIAMTADGTWQIDDRNFTTDPVPVANLVANQQSYGLDTTHSQLLTIEVKDQNGNWTLLKEIDEVEMAARGESISAYYDNAGTALTGTPSEYNIVGPSIFLYPTPSYNSTGGLRVRMQRPPSYFLTTDTTKTPGFTALHHTYLSDYATWKYAINRTMPAVASQYVGLVERWEKNEIPAFYSRRDRLDTTVLTNEPIEYL